MQAQKAGILEIGNVFVINKSDRDGVERTLRELQSMLMMNPLNEKYETPIILAKSNIGEGISAIKEAVDRHRAYLESSGWLSVKRSERNIRAFRNLVNSKLIEEIGLRLSQHNDYGRLEDEVKSGAFPDEEHSI